MFDNEEANPTNTDPDEDNIVDILDEVQNKTIAEVDDEEQLEANNNDIDHEVPVGEQNSDHAEDDLDRAE